MQRNRKDPSAADQAVEWLERLKNASPRDKEAFVRWLKESRAHVREILLASAWDVSLRGVDAERELDVGKLIAAASRNVISVDEQRMPSAPARSRRFRWPSRTGVGLAAACGAIILCASVAYWGFQNEYATSVGEQRTIELADGSVVSLNTQSRVRVKLSRTTRDLYLTGGQAIFSVARDAARPFRVHVGSAVIQAIGTKFDVRHIGDRTNVVVIEGRVQITPQITVDAISGPAPSARSTRLAAGQAVSISSHGMTAPTAVDVPAVTAWQQRRLKFRYSSLEEVVEEFNRYNRTPHIRVEGNDLRSRAISGVFEADDPESLIASLASDTAIAIDRGKNEWVIRSRAVAVPSAP